MGRRSVALDLDLIGTHAIKHAKDIPERFAEAYFNMMPNDESRAAAVSATIRNYLRVSLCNIHDELSTRIDVTAVTKALLPDGATAPR